VQSLRGQGYSLSRFFALEDVVDLLFQVRQFIHGVIPEDRILDPKINVREDIAESGDLFPVCFGISFLEIVRQILDCFADYLKIPDNCIPATAIRNKFLVRNPRGILLNIADRFKDVFKILEGGSTHRQPRRGYRVSAASLSRRS
jgi:hypothetical protein